MYQQILFAVEMDSKGIYFAVQKIKQLMDLCKAKVNLIHVVEYPPSTYFQILLTKS